MFHQIVKTILTLAPILAFGALPAQAQIDDYDGLEIAFFAGGCFWCTESDFEKIKGVVTVESGYMGGQKANPAYKEVASGLTRHRETVRVTYDERDVSYQTLLSAFWRMHDPSDAGGSFVDRGRQYGSAIFPTNKEQARLAHGAINALQASGKFERPIATEIIDANATKFYSAEGAHQDYYKRNPIRYRFYRSRSGRDQFIEKVWKGDDTLYQIKKSGTP